MAGKKRAEQPQRAPTRNITDAEWAIMEVVWEREPCAAGTVQEALQDTRAWAYSTVKTTMDRMVAKGLLVAKPIRNLNLFSSLVSRNQARRDEFRQFVGRAFDGAFGPMIQFLVDEQELSESELEQLRNLLRQPNSDK